jgi:hypothetical protein
MANFINKTLNFPEEIYTDEQGLSFHIIEKGTKIYRGDSNFNTNDYKNEDGEINYDEMNMEMLGDKKFVFFGFSLDDILNFNYGRPFEFEVIKEGGLRLLRVDNIETLQFIHDSTKDTKIQTIIEKNYILNDKRHRDSKKEEDYAFIEHLCKEYPEYDGYISDLTEQYMQNDLNAEMAICNPIEKVKLNKKLKGNKSDEQYTLDLIDIKNKLDLKKKRKKTKTREPNFDDERESLFTSPKKQKQPGTEASGNVYNSPEMLITPNTSPQKDLFFKTPGGKNKSKKSKKTKKAKKQTRKKKGKKN